MTPLRVLLVAAGGMLGTAARLGLTVTVPAGQVDWPVLTANVAGALLLGILTARMPAGDLRIFLGTGVLGGFTTYSALAVGSVTLWQSAPLLAAGYAAGSVLLGLAAAALGLRMGRPRPRDARNGAR